MAGLYTGQHSGPLGHLEPSTGEIRQVDLSGGSAPHGVIVGPDGAPLLGRPGGLWGAESAVDKLVLVTER